MMQQFDTLSTIEFFDPKRMSHKQKKIRRRNDKAKNRTKNLIILSCTWDIRVNPNKQEKCQENQESSENKQKTLNL